MRTSTVLALLFVGLLIAPPPSPVHLSYATSDSMEPTIGTGDGFLLVSTGDYEVGDVVTFYSEQRGEFVSHRIVGRTDGGYLTKGDANPSTDQAGGLPPVDDDQVLGELLVVAGMPVVVPSLGTVVAPVQANPGVAAGLALLVGLLALAGGRRRTRGRDVTQVDEVLRPVFATGLLGALVLLLVLSGTTYAFTYTAVEGTPQSGEELAVGEPANRTYRVQFARPPLTRTVVETEGMTVRNRSARNGTVTLDADIPPPSEPGRVETSIRTYAYPKTVPANVQRSLHEVHPWLATFVSVAVVFVPLYLLYALLVDGRAPLRSPRSRWWRRLGEER